MAKAALSILGDDKPGIISGITDILYKNKGNLEDISMTVMEGEFCMMLLFEYSAQKESKIASQLNDLAKRVGIEIRLKKLKKGAFPGKKHQKKSESHIITAFGYDRTGIVREISSCLASRGLNITDLDSRITRPKKGQKSLYMMLLEVDIPRGYAIVGLQRSLKNLAKKLKVEIEIKEAKSLVI